MILLPLIALLVLLVVLFVASGFVRVNEPEPAPAASCAGDCVPRSQLLAAQKLSAKRLAGWNRANRQVLRSRARARYFAYRHGTGVLWLDQALCIHGYESTDWANRGHHFGGMQFLVSTWNSVGGRGNPADANPVEQLYRAFLVWSRDGGSWREWSTAGMCGL